MEHKLLKEWTFWFDGVSNKNSKHYGDQIQKVGSCKTAEEFWGVFDAIPKLDTMEIGSDLSLFKNNVKPLWEDDANANGGKLQMIFADTEPRLCQQYWRDILLTAIGETFPFTECINGVVFSVRQHCRIALWVNKDGKQGIKEISAKFKEIVPIGNVVMFYQHDSNSEPIVC
ncbi:Eukaryotic translation initiation factor 4E [Entamoeba marina]